MANKEYKKLKKIVEKLRDPKDGCPWDLKQNHKSLLKFLIEESYEFVHAVENKDLKGMEEELGDILLQVLLHSTIANQNDNFTMESVCKIITDKLIRRHPHVFKKRDKKIKADQVLEKWEDIKKEEKLEKGTYKSEIDHGYLSFPAVMSAHKIGKKTNKLGFDWNNAAEVSKIVEGEWKEMQDEIGEDISVNKERIQEEFGDFMFSVVQLGRHLEIDSEHALREANKKFINRFQKMEILIKEDGQDFAQMNQKEMDKYWDKAKEFEKGKKNE